MWSALCFRSALSVGLGVAEGLAAGSCLGSALARPAPTPAARATVPNPAAIVLAVLRMTYSLSRLLVDFAPSWGLASQSWLEEASSAMATAGFQQLFSGRPTGWAIEGLGRPGRCGGAAG